MKYHLVLLSFTIISIFFISTAYSDISAKYDDDASETVNFTVKQDIKLICHSTEKVDEWKWEKDTDKDSAPLDKAGISKDRYAITDTANSTTLVLKNSIENDSGDYTCQATLSSGKQEERKIKVVSSIAVKVQSNINVVEGETLRILCNVAGKPSPTLHWTYMNSTYNETYDRSSGRVILEDEKNVTNAVLRIDDVQMFDRGEFTCIGSSPGTTDKSSTCMVRVKDKYAALWPFLGICAEVFVLCAIIFIYEKKRNKTELEESDTDQSPDQKNTPDHGKDSNLRHRQ